MSHAYFGRPQPGFTPGGAHVAVYLVPVFAGRLTVFDVTAPGVRGKWLPWTVMEYGANPYETAAALADDWCDGAISALEVADVLSFPFDADGRCCSHRARQTRSGRSTRSTCCGGWSGARPATRVRPGRAGSRCCSDGEPEAARTA